MGLKKVFLLLKDKLLKHVLSNDEKHTRLQREGYTQAFFIIPSITLKSHIALAINMGTKMTRTVTTAPILSIGNICISSYLLHRTQISCSVWAFADPKLCCWECLVSIGLSLNF